MYSQRLSLRYHLFIYRLVHSFFTDICRARWHNSRVLQCFPRAVAARSPAQELVLLLHLCLMAQSLWQHCWLPQGILGPCRLPQSRHRPEQLCDAALGGAAPISPGSSPGPSGAPRSPGAERSCRVPLAARALAHAVPGRRSGPRVLPDAVLLLGSKYKRLNIPFIS